MKGEKIYVVLNGLGKMVKKKKKKKKKTPVTGIMKLSF